MAFLALVDAPLSSESMKFPVFSLLAGNLGSQETGSLETASSSRESDANRRDGYQGELGVPIPRRSYCRPSCSYSRRDDRASGGSPNRPAAYRRSRCRGTVRRPAALRCSCLLERRQPRFASSPPYRSKPSTCNRCHHPAPTASEPFQVETPLSGAMILPSKRTGLVCAADERRRLRRRNSGRC